MTGDKFSAVTREETETYKWRSLLIPIVAKATIRPEAAPVSIEPFAGIYFSMGGKKIDMEEKEDYYTYKPIKLNFSPAVMGFIGGLDFGVKAGPGWVFLDTRIAADFGSYYEGKKRKSANEAFHRSKMMFGVGYKIGFGSL
jgi:hypothetical protein